MRTYLDEERHESDPPKRAMLDFEHADANADYTHWCRATVWRLDEAVALCFGKDPRTVNYASVLLKGRKYSWFNEYVRVHDWIQNALLGNALTDPIQPSEFIRWAKLKQIAYPLELEQKLVEYGCDIPGRYSYDKLVRERDELLAQIEKLEVLANESRPVDHGSAKERASMLRLIVGMAIGSYGYKPDELRSKVTSKIENHLRHAGVGLDHETILKHLREAAKQIPSETRHADD